MPMEFPIQSHLWLTSAWRNYIILSSAYITMEWRGQQHAREAVESTDPEPHHQHKTDEEELGTPQPGSDEEGHGRA